MTPTKTYKQRRKQTIQFLTQDETRRLFKTIKKLPLDPVKEEIRIAFGTA